MRHLRCLGRLPRKADTAYPWIQAAFRFLQDIFTIVIPLIENKNPQNPVPDPGSTND